MQLTHKIELDPTKDQIVHLEKSSGCARFAYNWGLNKWNEMYKDWKGNNQLEKPSALLIKKKFNEVKEKEYPWIYESPKDSNQQSFSYLGKSFNSFFKKKSKYPQFKSKHKNKSSFYISNDKFSIQDKLIKLPLIGEIRLKEKLRFETGRILNCTISKESNGKWFASIPVDINDDSHKKEKTVKNEVIGIDLGLTTFATCSDKSTFIAPKPLKKYTSKLKYLQRQHARKVKGSKNRIKSRIKLSRLFFRIKSIRNDFLHKLSTKICSENQTIVLEDLKVKNMIKNHKLAKAISDVSWSEFRRQVDYKSKIYGNKVVIADQYYPSSKTCSGCGCVNHDLKLSERTYTCKNCDLKLDRDFNASLNLHTLGLRGIDACGHLHTTGSGITSNLSIMAEARNNTCKSGNTFLHNL